MPAPFASASALGLGSSSAAGSASSGFMEITRNSPGGICSISSSTLLHWAASPAFHVSDHCSSLGFKERRLSSAPGSLLGIAAPESYLGISAFALGSARRNALLFTRLTPCRQSCKKKMKPLPRQPGSPPCFPSRRRRWLCVWRSGLGFQHWCYSLVLVGAARA